MNKAKLSTIIVSLLLIVLLSSTLSIGCAPKGPMYPSQSISIIVPFPPGGPVDLMARGYAEAFKTILPQPTVIINKRARRRGSIPGTWEAISAKPDGYSIVINTTQTFTATPLIQADMPFKGAGDITPIITAGIVSNVFCVGVDQPWKTMKDLITSCQRPMPGKIRIAHAGVGTPTQTHLAHLELLAGIDITDVPQSGAAPAITAVLGNQIEGLVLNGTAVVAQVQAGKLRVLATFTKERLQDLDPNAPTMKEVGYDTITEGSTYIVAGPKNLPKEVVNTLYDAFKKATQDPAFKKLLKDNVIIVDTRGYDEWTKQLQEDTKFYGTFLKQIGLIK